MKVTGIWALLLIVCSLVVSCGSNESDPTKKYSGLKEKFVPEHGFDSQEQGTLLPSLITLKIVRDSDPSLANLAYFEVGKTNTLTLRARVLDPNVNKVGLELVKESNKNSSQMKLTPVKGQMGDYNFSWTPTIETLGRTEPEKAEEVRFRVTFDGPNSAALEYLKPVNKERSISIVLVRSKAVPKFIGAVAGLSETPVRMDQDLPLSVSLEDLSSASDNPPSVYTQRGNANTKGLQEANGCNYIEIRKLDWKGDGKWQVEMTFSTKGLIGLPAQRRQNGSAVKSEVVNTSCELFAVGRNGNISGSIKIIQPISAPTTAQVATAGGKQ